MVILETPRLRLRDLQASDAEFVLRLVNEASFLANIGDKGVRNLADARRFIQSGPWSYRREDGYGQFLTELVDDRTPIGVCGLLYREILDVSDVGIALLPEYWRSGYAFEAASAVMEYGRGTLGIETIVGLTSVENLASIGLLEKMGLRFQKMVKMSEEDPGTALYS